MKAIIWQAQWNSGKIFRYAPAPPDGQENKIIAMPVQRPTSYIFGGSNLDRLYVTSCSQGIGETEILPLHRLVQFLQSMLVSKA